MSSWSQACERAGQTIGFVPTMGNLHEGHLSLVEQATHYANKVVVSIFVNPTQFSVDEDLELYPRTEEEDLKKLQSKKVDAVFMPTVSEIYPENKAIEYLDVDAMGTVYEGAARPEHFRGVVTVVKKLFDCVRPQHAIFGEKDYQQLLLIRQMEKQQALNIQIHAGEIVRDEDGLAKSSRNQYLSEAQRKIAPVIYQSLLQARAWIQNNELSINEAEKQSIDFIEKNGLKVDYFSIRDAHDLSEPKSSNRVILVAAQLGETRLLDNLHVA